MLIDLDEKLPEKDRIKIINGPPPKVKIVAERVANKKQTVIFGLEVFKIDYDELSDYLRHKLATAVTMNKLPLAKDSKKELFSVRVQGNQINLICGILNDKYHIGPKYVVTEDKIEKKKKAKAAAAALVAAKKNK